jgi:hypothetical protein
MFKKPLPVRPSGGIFVLARGGAARHRSALRNEQQKEFRVA